MGMMLVSVVMAGVMTRARRGRIGECRNRRGAHDESRKAQRRKSRGSFHSSKVPLRIHCAHAARHGA